MDHADHETPIRHVWVMENVQKYPKPYLDDNKPEMIAIPNTETITQRRWLHIKNSDELKIYDQYHTAHYFLVLGPQHNLTTESEERKPPKYNLQTIYTLLV